jgi:hypothetical protein
MIILIIGIGLLGEECLNKTCAYVTYWVFCPFISLRYIHILPSAPCPQTHLNCVVTFFFPWRCGGLVPKRGCLLTLAYYVFPRWYEFRERRWNDILTGENRRTRRKTCPGATLFTINLTRIDPGANPGVCGERPATNDLSHGTSVLFPYCETPSFISIK